MQQFIQINGKRFALNDPELKLALADSYGSNICPKCLCKPQGIDMYISQIGTEYVLKRMPNSGMLHDEQCICYDPSAELSGVSALLNKAIKEDPLLGVTSLTLNFPLFKKGEQDVAVVSAEKEEKPQEQSTAKKTAGQKLSLRGLLDYFWEEARLNRWSPAMEGKRNWNIVRKYLLQALGNKRAKKCAFVDICYIPEIFSVAQKDNIFRKQTSFFLRAVSSRSKQPLNMIIGEIKSLGVLGDAYQIVLKHMPESHFSVSQELYTKLTKTSETIISLWQALEETHLILIATFSCDVAGKPSLEHADFMLTNENWIPFENIYEKMLIDFLTQQSHYFIKSLRYGLDLKTPATVAILPHTKPNPSALYIIEPQAPEAYKNAIQEAQSSDSFTCWTWDIAGGEMPKLPTKNDT